MFDTNLFWYMGAHLVEKHAPATEAPLQLHYVSPYRLPQLEKQRHQTV